MNPQYQNTLPPPPTKRHVSRFSPKLLVIGICAIFAILAAIALLIVSNSNNPVSQMQHLSARFDSLQTILKEGTKNTQGDELKKVQSDASILILSQTALIKSAMKDAGLGDVPKDIKTLETDSTTLKTLSDAQLNGQFDSAYQKALSQKLESTMALIREISDKTNSKSLKNSLSTAYAYFGNILDQLAKL